MVKYTLEELPELEPSYRLIINGLECDVAPAMEFAFLYHRRWFIVLAFDEFKSHLAERGRLAQQVVATTRQVADNLLFIHAVWVLQRRLPDFGAIPP